MSDTIEVVHPGMLCIYCAHLDRSFQVRLDEIVGVKQVGLGTTFITTTGARRNIFIGWPREDVLALIREAKKGEVGARTPTSQLDLLLSTESEDSNE